MSRVVSLAAIILPLARLAAQAPGPDQPDLTPTIRITVNLVQVDAVVTDAKGRQVTDLRPDDFEILEDARPQRITNFSYQRTASGGVPPSPALRPAEHAVALAAPSQIHREQLRRTIALVVDDLGLSVSSLNDVKRSLRKFLEEQMQPGDLVAILRTAGGMGSLQQFTADRRILEAAVDRLRWFLGRGGVGPLEPLDSDLLKDPEDERGQRRPDAAQIEMEHVRHESLILGTFGAIRSIVAGLEDVPGRKSVILFADGLAAWLPKGNGTMSSTGMRPLLEESLQKLIDQANRSSVVLYAIDARGIQSLTPDAAESMYLASGKTPAGSTAASPFPSDELGNRIERRARDYVFSQDGLAYLAGQTGGFAVVNQNDINRGIGRVLDDQSGYYLIGYKPDAATFQSGKEGPRYHKIEVKVQVPGLHVRSRSGFFGVPSEEARAAASTPEEQLLAALRSPFGASGIRLRLTSLFASHAHQGTVVRNLLHLDARDLSFSDVAGEKVARIEIAATAQGEDGRLGAHKMGASELRVGDADFESTLGSGLLYELDLPTRKPGVYQMRVAVRDSATGRVGSASQFIETPDLKNDRMALSGLYLSAEPGGVEKNEMEVMRHAALRLFRPGQMLSFSFQVYNASSATHLEARLLLWRDGRPVFKVEPSPLKPTDTTDPKRLLATGSFRLAANIPPGPYVLEIVVHDKTAKQSALASQAIDFEVVR